MKKLTEGLAAALGLLAGAAAVSVTYLGHRLAGLPYLPFDVFEWMARTLPGGLIARTIDAMVAVIRALRIGPTASTAKMAEQGLALGQFALAWLVLALIVAAAGKRRPRRRTLFGTIGGFVLFVAAAGIEWARGFPGVKPLPSLVWLGVVLVGGGALLGRALAAAAETSGSASPQSAPGRRRFLRLAGTGSFLVIVTAAGVSLLSRGDKKTAAASDQEELALAAKSSGPAASPPPAELEKRPAPVAGTRPELTANRDFYRIDIDLKPPAIDASSWRLELKGLVEKPLKLSLDDIRGRPRQTQALTLECISNPVGGDLIGTSFWTGTPLKGVLDEAVLKEGVQEIAIRSADDFYESVPLAEALDPRTLLVHEMNGKPLPVAHGFPLRIYIPGRFGMKQPKWIVQMEAIDHKGHGFWVDRNWSATAPVLTTSVIDAVDAKGGAAAGGLVEVGGIAYAGDQGISRVEVRVDGGPWEEAELRDPPLSPLTWVLWRYDWRATPGRHVLNVRATDGAGRLQSAEERGSYPDGATGLYKKTADIPK